MHFARFGQKVEAAHAGHVHVGENQNQTGLGFGDYFERLHPRPREIHLEPGRAQVAAELLAKQSLDIGLVVDHENKRVQ